MDRITRLILRNIRVFEEVVINLSGGVTALYGDHGSGKSTVVECIEMLQRTVYQYMRVPSYLERVGAPWGEVVALVEDDEGEEPPVEYRIRIRQGADDDGFLEEEELTCEGLTVMRWRPGTGGHVLDASGAQVPLRPDLMSGSREGDSVMSYLIIPELMHPTYRRMQRALRRIVVHDTADNMKDILSGEDDLLREETRALILLGVGIDVSLNEEQQVVMSVDGLPGTLPAGEGRLSDGQSAWTSIVTSVMALKGNLDDRDVLLIVDNVERDLGNGLQRRAVELLQNLPPEIQVVFTSRSDNAIGMLRDPAASLRVFEMSRGSATVSELDPEELARFTEHFGDVGEISAAGYLSRVLNPT